MYGLVLGFLVDYGRRKERDRFNLQTRGGKDRKILPEKWRRRFGILQKSGTELRGSFSHRKPLFQVTISLKKRGRKINRNFYLQRYTPYLTGPSHSYFWPNKTRIFTNDLYSYSIELTISN